MYKVARFLSLIFLSLTVIIVSSQPVIAASSTLPTTGPQNSILQPQSTTLPKVVSKSGGEQLTELPKTGLPLLAWALAGLIPVGYKLRNKKVLKNNCLANNLWEDRQFKL